MAKIDNYEVNLTDEQIKQKILYYERQAQGVNWVTFKPGAPMEIRTYGITYYNNDYKEFKEYIKTSIKDKSVHTLTLDDGTQIPVILVSAGLYEKPGEVNTVRGSIKMLILDGYDFTADTINETIENIWGVE